MALHLGWCVVHGARLQGAMPTMEIRVAPVDSEAQAEELARKAYDAHRWQAAWVLNDQELTAEAGPVRWWLHEQLTRGVYVSGPRLWFPDLHPVAVVTYHELDGQPVRMERVTMPFRRGFHSPPPDLLAATSERPELFLPRPRKRWHR